MDSWLIRSDTRQGRLALETAAEIAEKAAAKEAQQSAAFQPAGDIVVDSGVKVPSEEVHATILAPTEPGDQTVPMRSSDHQLRSGKFKGIFRQTGYDHQGSYQNAHAVASTLYSIVRIAQQATLKES